VSDIVSNRQEKFTRKLETIEVGRSDLIAKENRLNADYRIVARNEFDRKPPLSYFYNLFLLSTIVFD